MTSTVSPVGSDPSGHDPLSDIESDPSTVRKGRLRRIAEEEYILVVLLAGFGLIFLLIFPPALVVNDSWLNLVAGREVIENGLPSRRRAHGLRARRDVDRPAVARPGSHVRRLQPRRIRAPLDRDLRLRGRSFLDRGRSGALARRRSSGVLGDVPARARRGAVGVVDPRTDARPPAVHRSALASHDAGTPTHAKSVARRSRSSWSGRACTGASLSARFW